MAQPGWYHDPDGTPARLRFWDGQGWTDHTREAPEASPTPRRTRFWPGLVAGLGALALAGGAFVGLGPAVASLTHPTSDPTPVPAATAPRTATTPRAQPSPSASPTPSAVTACVDADGWIGGSHTRVRVPDTWEQYSLDGPAALTCSTAKQIQTADNWVSMIAVGRHAGASSAEAAGMAMFDWFRQVGYPAETQLSDATSQKTPVQGREAFAHVATLTTPDSPADTLRVLAVKNPDGSYDVLITAATVGNAANNAEIDAMWKSLEIR